MKEKVFKKDHKNYVEKSKYFSTVFWDIYYPKKKNLIKNYLITPDSRVI